MFDLLTLHHVQCLGLGLVAEFDQGPASLVAGGKRREKVFLLVGEGFVVLSADFDRSFWHRAPSV